MQPEHVVVINATRNTELGDRIRIAQTSLTRMLGLLPRRCLSPGEGLLIHPSQGVHTIGMRFPIDVIFLDANFTVTHLHRSLRPFRITVVHWKARSVLELPDGTIAATSTQVGDQLDINSVVR